MALQYSPKIISDGLVMCVDASQNSSLPTVDLPIKDGLLLWLDASDDSTFSYSSGTEVSQWRDKSGNNFHANELQAVGNKPSRNTVVNGRKSLNFTSTEGDRLRVNSGMVFTNSVTAIVLIKPGSQNYAYANIIDQDHGMSGTANGWVIQRNGATAYWQSWVANAAGDTWFNPNQISYTDNTPQIVTLRKGSSTVALYSNGTSSGDVSISDQSIRQASYYGLNIGSWRAGGFSDRHYNGEICEIVIYNKTLSLTELKKVHTYLGIKWGILNTDRSIIDVSGNSNDGLLGNGTAANIPVTDYYNKGSLRFDGSNDYITIPYSSTLDVNNFSISFMFKTSTNDNSHDTICARNGDVYSSANGWSISRLRNGLSLANCLRFYIWGNALGMEIQGPAISDGIWRHATITVSTASSFMKIYINGVIYNTINALPTGNFYSGTPQFKIGADKNNTDVWTGNIASLCFYNRTLTDAEILQNYNAIKSRFDNTLVQLGLVLNLDAGNPYSYAGAGTTWYDTSGNSYNGTLTNGPVYSNVNGGVIVFDGSNDYIDLTSTSVSISGNAARSVFCWIKTTQSGLIGFVSLGTAANSQAFNLVKYSSNVGVMGYNNDYYPSSGNSGKNIIDGNWHYIGATFDGTNVRTYVDGILDNTSGTITYSTTGQNNYLGRSNHTGNENFLNGNMSSVNIYNRALSDAEVLQNYNATKGKFGV